MLKILKSFLFVIGVVMIFTAQANRPDDKNKQHASSFSPEVQVKKESPQRSPQPQRREESPQNSQRAPQEQNRREAPKQEERRETSPEQGHASQQSHQLWQGPRVYAVQEPAPVENNNLFHRQHHKNWQPRYNFYDNQYHFYPYVNIATEVELSGSYFTINFNGQNYYYNDGTFYVQDENGQFEAVAPPIGIIVNFISPDAHQIQVDDQVYWRYKGVCYVQVAGGYQVVPQVQYPSDYKDDQEN